MKNDINVHSEDKEENHHNFYAPTTTQVLQYKLMSFHDKSFLLKITLRKESVYVQKHDNKL
jgi:hypothetical protein